MYAAIVVVAMSSYEPGRTCVYSKDLRWRMVYQRLGMGLSLKMVGENLGVDQSTIHRTVELFLKLGDVEKKKYEGNNVRRKVTDEVRYRRLGLLGACAYYSKW